MKGVLRFLPFSNFSRPWQRWWDRGLITAACTVNKELMLGFHKFTIQRFDFTHLWTEKLVCDTLSVRPAGTFIHSPLQSRRPRVRSQMLGDCHLLTDWGETHTEDHYFSNNGCLQALYRPKKWTTNILKSKPTIYQFFVFIFISTALKPWTFLHWMSFLLMLLVPPVIFLLRLNLSALKSHSLRI